MRLPAREMLSCAGSAFSVTAPFEAGEGVDVFFLSVMTKSFAPGAPYLSPTGLLRHSPI